MLKRTLIISLFYLLLTPWLMSQEPIENSIREIDKYIKDSLELDVFSGTVLITKNDKIVYNNAVGLANKSYNIKNNLDTKFNIGSIGKVFTATAIMQLVEKGIIGLDDSIVKYLNDFPYPDKEKITITRLLTHTAGIGDYMENDQYHNIKSDIREISDLLPVIYNAKPVARPGEKHIYSNSGMVLLGAVIEKATKKKYREYIEENIFKPLIMNDTDFICTDDVLSNTATGYFLKNADEYQSNIFKLKVMGLSDGGVYSTVRDLLKFDQGLKSNKILKNEFQAMMYQPSEQNKRYGLGWEILDFFGHKIFGHSGGHYGVSAIFYRLIDDGYNVIVLSNYSDGAFHVAVAIMRILYDENPEPMDSNRANAIKSSILFEQKKYEESFKVLDRNISGKNPHLQSHYLAARLRIEAGIELTDAVQLLDKYIKFAPDTMKPGKAAAWWRKGLAYEKLNNKKQAKTCYEKSLELDPEFELALKSMESLDDKK